MACERCVSVDEVNERYLGIIHFFHFLAIILERVQGSGFMGEGH